MESSFITPISLLLCPLAMRMDVCSQNTFLKQLTWDQVSL